MRYLNKDFFKNLKGKLKTIKEKKVRKLSILSLATILLLTSCGITKDTNSLPKESNDVGYYQENVINNQVVDSIETESSTIVQSDLSQEELALLEQNVTMEESDYNNFVSSIHGIRVKYEGSQYFQIEQALEKYNSIKEYDTVSSNFILNGKIDEAALKEQVKKNNEAYLSSTSGTKFTRLDDEYFERAFSDLMDSLNYQLSSDANMDIAQLDDKLTNLTILRTTSQASGMVTDDGIMALNLEDIANRQLQYPNVNYFRMTVLHEGTHLGQLSSVKERTEEGYSRNLGISYSWDDLNVNSLFHKWHVEASAEYLKFYEYGKGAETSTYENQVKALESLVLATILREGADETSAAKVSLQSDLNQLFMLFNCQTDLDKLEIIEMMYSLEICLNQPTEFTKFYKESTGNTLDLYHYQDSLRSSISQTLTKKFYENLASYTAQSTQISLKEAFSMMAAFELEMSRFTKYSNDYYMDANDDFIQVYQSIQGEYLSLLAKSLNMSLDDITSLYVSYYHDGIATTNQTNLSEGEADFINRLLESRNTNRQKTVFEMGQSKTK